MLINKLNEISNSKDLKFNETSINQTQRNNLIVELTKAFIDTLAAYSGASQEDGVYVVNDNLKFAMVNNKTIEFEIDNENVGFIPFRISLSIPNFDENLSLADKVEEYALAVAEKEQKKAEKEQKKAEREAERKANKTV